MSSAQRAVSSAENVKLVIDALDDYAKETGKDLSSNPFADKFQQSNSPEDILQLLEEREKAFKEYREGNRRLINCLNPAVKVLYAFSGILGQAASLVSQPCRLVRLLMQLSSDPLPTSKRLVCWDRYSSQRTSLEYTFLKLPCDV
jgi:fungal STAND N-terminal Goodbye domain